MKKILLVNRGFDAGSGTSSEKLAGPLVGKLFGQESANIGQATIGEGIRSRQNVVHHKEEAGKS